MVLFGGRARILERVSCENGVGMVKNRIGTAELQHGETGQGTLNGKNIRKYFRLGDCLFCAAVTEYLGSGEFITKKFGSWLWRLRSLRLRGHMQ
jgi:hypothetical protein